MIVINPIIADKCKRSAKKKIHDGMKSRGNFYKLNVIKKWMSIAQVYEMTHFSGRMNPNDIPQIIKYLKALCLYH